MLTEALAFGFKKIRRCGVEGEQIEVMGNGESGMDLVGEFRSFAAVEVSCHPALGFVAVDR